ncbi:hypothetical protein [Aurantibacillus circumpalustris]|uniref:hypothetical protein n=1 Tax=Aurantibacillus circumpalustris TaxID=3036359 RepID=UPI00295AF87D|nr:hypothetical protein [Aurantibacillus circumpalustris]
MTPIKIENKFLKFKTNFEKLPMLVKSEIAFPPRSEKQVVETEDNHIKFELTFPGDTIKNFRFQVGGLFSLEELKSLAEIFQFVVAPHIHHPDQIMGSLENFSPVYKNYCLGSIIKKENSYYLLIFSKRGTTSFEEDILYVHGIWKVLLSEGFIEKLAKL